MTRMTGRVALVLALLTVPAGTAIEAQQASTPFYPASDATHEIEAAFTAAGRDGKYVLLDFGADWCPDCRVLGGLFEDPAVAPVVTSSFHVVRIDVGRRDKNADLVKTCMGDLRRLDSRARRARRLAAHDRHDHRHGARDASDDAVRACAPSSSRWAPKTPMTTLGSFHQGGVRVDVRLERDAVNQRWLSAAFVPERVDTHLYSTDLPAAGIDGLGRPTHLAVVAAQGLWVTGPLVVDRPVTADPTIEGLHLSLPVYPAGPVTLRLPVRVRASARRPRCRSPTWPVAPSAASRR